MSELRDNVRICTVCNNKDTCPDLCPYKADLERENTIAGQLELLLKEIKKKLRDNFDNYDSMVFNNISLTNDGIHVNGFIFLDPDDYLVFKNFNELNNILEGKVE